MLFLSQGLGTMKLRTQNFVANYQSSQVSLHLHLNLVQHASKLAFLPVPSPVAYAFSNTLPVVHKLLNRDKPVFDSWANSFR